MLKIKASGEEICFRYELQGIQEPVSKAGGTPLGFQEITTFSTQLELLRSTLEEAAKRFDSLRGDRTASIK